MKISDLIRSLEESKKSLGDVLVKIDLGVNATTGKSKYVDPGTGVVYSADGQRRKPVLVLW